MDDGEARGLGRHCCFCSCYSTEPFRRDDRGVWGVTRGPHTSANHEIGAARRPSAECRCTLRCGCTPLATLCTDRALLVRCWWEQGARYVFAVDSKSCDVEEAFRPVLGACGGAGVKVETVASGTIDNGKLVRVMRQYTLGGWLSDVQATLASMDVDTVLPMDTDNVRCGVWRVHCALGSGWVSFLSSHAPPSRQPVQVEVHMSLYAPDGDLFVGVKLLASLADGGAAPGSVSASTEVNSVRLFHWRFPPSLAFEVVVGTIIASQILMTVWRMVSSPFSVLEFLRRERSLYDVTLLALFVWLLVKVSLPAHCGRRHASC